MSEPSDSPTTPTAEQQEATVDAVRAKRRLDPIGLAEPVSLSDRQRVYESFYYEDERRKPYLSRFVILMILSATIAGLGLVNDSAAVVIGAMLIAPLMTPLLANSAAIVEGWPRRFGESLLTVLLGAGLGILVGFLIAQAIPRVQSEMLLPGEIIGRTEPNLVDLAIALAAGAAGAYVMIRSEAGSALPGVGIAVALVPPLATVGITFGIGETDLAAGALLLFATNWLAIVFAAGVVFALAGFGAHRDAWGRFQGSLAAVGLVALLLILAIPLGLNAVQRWGDSNANRVAAEVVTDWDPTLTLENLVVDTTADPTQVTVDVAGSTAPQDTDALADSLASSLEEPVVLRVRFRPEFVAGEIALDSADRPGSSSVPRLAAGDDRRVGGDSGLFGPVNAPRSRGIVGTSGSPVGRTRLRRSGGSATAQGGQTMSSLHTAGHEHHERIREHVDRMPPLADMLEERPVPDEFGPRFAAEYDFMTGTLWPHVQVVESNVYPELERLQQNRHSMAHLRREHEQLAELIEKMGGYMDRVEAGGLNPTDALGLRRAILSFYALVKTHIGEEAEYLRVLESNLSEDEQAAVEDGLEHASR